MEELGTRAEDGGTESKVFRSTDRRSGGSVVRDLSVSLNWNSFNFMFLLIINNYRFSYDFELFDYHLDGYAKPAKGVASQSG